MEHYDLLIIGAGPVGMGCGIAAKRANLSYKIIDKGTLVNSLHNFPTHMTFFSSAEKLEIGGIPFTSLSLRPNKQEGLEYFRRVAEHYDLNLGFYESFDSFQRLTKATDGAHFKINTSKHTYTANAIVNATGFYDIPVLLNVPGEQLDKVKHYFTSAHHLFKQNVAVIGASNSAIDVALEAYRKGANTTLIIRGSSIGDNVKYWIKPDIEARIAEGHIKVYYHSTIEDITDTHINFSTKDQRFTLENDFVYAMTGYQPNFELCKTLGVEINSETGYPKYNETTLETTSPNIYLAGVIIGGLNTKGWFIENTKDHGEKIVNHIKGNI